MNIGRKQEIKDPQISGLTDNAEVIEMFSETVNPACVVNSRDKSINSTFLGWRVWGRPVGCLGKQQILNLVGLVKLIPGCLKKQLAEVISCSGLQFQDSGGK